MRIFKAGTAYFLWVFATGFVLGVVRELWLAPQLGARAAELAEMPVMLLVVVLAARWTTRRFALPPTPAVWLGAGGFAVGWLLLAEIALVLGLRGMSLADYLAGRDPVAGAAYAISLLLMAAMPWLLGRWAGRR
ncbi:MULTISPECIES: hypothetical protein [unclassified Guyparkeria]|uniref:hypothetical protein n=1 Tax=unclassified Guyparkeria TaxID=2626246 RepID=UPI00073384D1|nr:MULTISPECIES: hypothetical protein [unclassified Guyparkeria]KTG17635.1 hypothetical protein AUR63_08305 [Guyparkeria sp. XI15]OAE88448.1 hypothetical protein AWR35_08320 [Guyparkeria sp. WRN-7]